MDRLRHHPQLLPADLLGAAGRARGAAAVGRTHVPALDGFRGCAISLVLLCHYASLLPRCAFSGALGLGWIGVDQFFVLSGFLITGILLDAKGSPHYFRNFYLRRVLRIFPLYYAFLLAILLILLTLTWVPLSSFAPLRDDSHQGLSLLWHAQPWVFTYTANVWVAFQHTWSGWTEMLIPLWSLSVEEQFYFLWPLIVFHLSHRALLRIGLGILLGALALRFSLHAAGLNWLPMYYLTPTRADALAAGALVALLLRLPRGPQCIARFSTLAAVLSLSLLLLAAPGFNPILHPWARDLLYTPLALLFAAFLGWALNPRSLRGLPQRFYQLSFLRALGGYSYGIYIIHLPVVYLTANLAASRSLYDIQHPAWPSALALIALNIVLTFTLAFLSFHLLEKPFLRLKRHFPESPPRHPLAPPPAS